MLNRNVYFKIEGLNDLAVQPTAFHCLCNGLSFMENTEIEHSINFCLAQKHKSETLHVEKKANVSNVVR